MADQQPAGGVPSPDDANRIVEVKRLFLAARAMSIAERDIYLLRECGRDADLRQSVLSLLEGERAPLPFESLADDIRAARDRIADAPTAASFAGSDERPGEHAGDRIGRYRVIERLGEGGFGVVYLAQQLEPVKRRVALKIIKLGMDTKQVVARFEAERQALALMDHPNIAHVLDAGATETGRPYFVMELVKGLSITDYCDRHNLTIRDRLGLIAQVCAALQHAHQRGVIHRDIKPSNVLVSTAEGDKPIPKIIDFGIAKATSARLTERTIFTEFRQMIGTPEYMSPEQAGESNEDIDTRTDVYSTGVLMYELLAGATPFDSKRLRSAAFGEMQRIIREEDPPRPSTKVRTGRDTLGTVAQRRGIAAEKLTHVLHGDLDWIVMKALDKDRRRRYESASAMEADIQRYLTGHAVLAAPPNTWYQATKFVRRNRGPVLAASLLALAMVGGLIGTSAGFFNAETQRKVAEREKNRADDNAAEARAAETGATRQAYSANLMSASSAINAVQYSTARAFLDAAPASLRGWEWHVLHSTLDRSLRTIAASRPLGLGTVDQLEPHPDGRSFFTVVGNTDPVAQRWDLSTGRLLQSFLSPNPLSGLDSTIVSLDPGGGRLTIMPRFMRQGSKAFRVESWDLLTGQRSTHAEVGLPGNVLIETIPSADGARLTVYSGERVWTVSTATGEVLAEGATSGDEFPRQASPDGTMIAEGTRSSPFQVKLRDARTLAPKLALEANGFVRNVSFSSDSRWLGVVGSDDTARVWDLSTAPPTFVALRHPFEACNIRFSPDAALVASIALDHAIRVWDRATGRLLSTYASESLDPHAVMFMPDGKTVAGWELDGRVRFWDITSERTTVLRGHKSIVAKARFVPNNPAGLIISSSWEGYEGSTDTVRLWDADSGDEVAVYRGQLGDIAYNLAVSDDGRFAAIGVWDHIGTLKSIGGEDNRKIGRVELLDLATGELVYSTPTSRRTAWVGFASDNRSVIVADFVLSSGVECQVHTLDARTGAVVRTKVLDPKSDWIFARGPDGANIAALPLSRGSVTTKADHPGTVLFLDSQTLETVREIDGIPEGQVSMAFSPDGSRITTGGPDGVVRIFDAQTGSPLATMSGQGMEIITLAFCPDGIRLASAGLDRKVTIWNAATFEPVAAFGGHEGHIGDLCWDQTGQRLVSCSGDFTVRIWDSAPIRTRIEAGAQRAASIARVEPKVGALFTQLGNSTEVVRRINADTSLSPLDRKTALQVALRTALDATATRAISSDRH